MIAPPAAKTATVDVRATAGGKKISAAGPADRYTDN